VSYMHVWISFLFTNTSLKLTLQKKTSFDIISENRIENGVQIVCTVIFFFCLWQLFLVKLCNRTQMRSIQMPRQTVTSATFYFILYIHNRHYTRLLSQLASLTGRSVVSQSDILIDTQNWSRTAKSKHALVPLLDWKRELVDLFFTQIITKITWKVAFHIDKQVLFVTEPSFLT